MKRSSVVTLLGIIFFYLTLIINGNAPFGTRQPTEYYHELTAGFLSGHTYLTLTPDQRLSELKNPYAGYQGIVRLHDASYYNNRYYLYFGPTPAILFVLPVKILTGYYPSEEITVGIFGLVGFGFIAALWLRAIKIALPYLGSFGINFGLAVLALGTFVLTLLPRALLYPVPITCAYSVFIAGLYFLTTGYVSRSDRAKVLCIGIAALAWGLAIGARPNYIFTLPVLGVAALIVAYRRDADRKQSRTAIYVPALLAAVLPPGIIGVLLAIYNYVRFGTINEFGMRYQLASSDQRFIDILSLKYVSENLSHYFLDPPLLFRYFPFIATDGPCFGIVYWVPFALLGFLTPLTWYSRKMRTTRGWVWLSATLFSVSVLQLAGLSFLAFAYDRYQVDFVPVLTLCALLVFGALNSVLRTKTKLRRFIFGVGVATGLFGISANILLSIERSPLRSRLSSLATLLNYPGYVWEKINNTSYGPLKGEISLGPGPVGSKEPMVVTSYGRDILFAECVADNQYRFSLFHAASTTTFSDVVTVEPGKFYRFVFDLGSLYPPKEHPLFARYPSRTVDALSRKVKIEWDGKVILDAGCGFYLSSPNLLHIGENPWNDFTRSKTSGCMVNLSRGGIPDQSSVSVNEKPGAVRLTLRFPPFISTIGEPLVSTGTPDTGDLIFINYIEPGKIQLGHDSKRFGALLSRVIPCDPTAEHTVDIDTPALNPNGSSEENENFYIRFDGETVLSGKRKFGPSHAIETAFGYNAAQSSSVKPLFSGPVLKWTQISPLSPPETTAHHWGPLRLAIRLPTAREGVSEPLVTTGVPGRGDFIYLRYLPENRIRVGYDHWGIGGFLSDPVVLKDVSHAQLEISIGSLYPPLDDPWWAAHRNFPPSLKHHVFVSVDDKIVMNTPYEAHPAELKTIRIGENPIGGSTCVTAFTGEIDSVKSTLTPPAVK